jgi:hypothetical protein
MIVEITFAKSNKNQFKFFSMKTRHLTLLMLVAVLTIFGTSCKKKKKVAETPKPTGEVLING